MKYLLVLVLSSAVVVMSKGCSSDNDCDEDECCVSYLFSSKCQNLSDEGKSCNILGRLGRKKHVGICPCKTGLECENTKKTILGIEFDPRCVKPEEPETEAPEPETEAPEPETETPEPETEAPEPET